VVERLGIDRVVNRGFVVIGILLVALVLVTVMSSGTPSFWLFIPILGLMLSSFMFLMPNLNSAAMDPLGDIAGSGSALTGAVRVAGGAILGGFISEQVDTSVTPLVIGISVMVACSALAVWLVRRGGLRSILG